MHILYSTVVEINKKASNLNETTGDAEDKARKE